MYLIVLGIGVCGWAGGSQVFLGSLSSGDRTQWVPFGLLFVCAIANSPSFSQNSPSLPQNSVSSLLRVLYSRNSIPPVPHITRARKTNKHKQFGRNSSESKCHFRGVFFRCVPGVLPLHKRRGILLPPGAFRKAFQGNDTCFPLFCCVCDLGTSVTFAWVQGEVPRELPSAREIPQRKMTLWKWHLDALEEWCQG